MSGSRFFLAGALAMAAASAVWLPLAPSAHAARHNARNTGEALAKPKPAGVELLGKVGAWSAYASNDRSGRVCYLAGEPRKSEPAGAARKAPMAMVTHRPAENIANVVSFVEGYPLKPGSNVVLDVGGRKFELFTKDDSAWASTSDLDRTIVTALDRAKVAIARGEPPRGPGTIDVYSLAGFPQALALIDKACGIKREEIAVPAASATGSAHAPRRHPHHQTPHHEPPR